VFVEKTELETGNTNVVGHGASCSNCNNICSISRGWNEFPFSGVSQEGGGQGELEHVSSSQESLKTVVLELEVNVH